MNDVFNDAGRKLRTPKGKVAAAMSYININNCRRAYWGFAKATATGAGFWYMPTTDGQKIYAKAFVDSKGFVVHGPSPVVEKIMDDMVQLSQFYEGLPGAGDFINRLANQGDWGHTDEGIFKDYLRRAEATVSLDRTYTEQGCDSLVKLKHAKVKVVDLTHLKRNPVFR